MFKRLKFFKSLLIKKVESRNILRISPPITSQKKLNLDNITFVKSAAPCLNEQLIESFFKQLIARILENNEPERNSVRYKGLGYIAYISEVFFNSFPKIEINITNKQTQEVSFAVDIRGVDFKQSTPMTDIEKFTISEEGTGLNARYFNFSFSEVGSQEKHKALKVNGVKLVLTPGLAKHMETLRRSATNETVTAEKNCELSHSNAKLPLPTSMDWGILKKEIHEIIFHVSRLPKAEIESMLLEGLNNIESIRLNDAEKQGVLNETKDLIVKQQQKLREGVLNQAKQYYDIYGFRLMANNPSNIGNSSKIKNYRKSQVLQAGKGNINFYTGKASEYIKPTLEPMKPKSKIRV